MSSIRESSVDQAPGVSGDPLRIAGREFHSRLLLGTGGFPSLDLLAEAIALSGSELVTVALRRVETSANGTGGHGGHARYMKVPVSTLVPLPEALSFVTGAAICCGTGTAWYGSDPPATATFAYICVP